MSKKCSKCKRDFPASKDYFHGDKKRKDGLYPHCKECRSGRKIFTSQGNKVCKKCEKELLANKDYFFINNTTKDKFNHSCKECDGYSYTNKLEIPDGMNQCIKCESVLPHTDEYFVKDNSTKFGLRNVCLKCRRKNGSYGKPKETFEWTLEEDEILIANYAHHMNEELILKYFSNRTKRSIESRANKLGLSKSEETKRKMYQKHSEFLSSENSPIRGIKRSEETKREISKIKKEQFRLNYDKYVKFAKYERTPEIRKKMSDSKTSLGLWKGENNPRHKNPLCGSDNGRWLGGITPITFWMRNQMSEWKQDSMKKCNYKCIITGENFDEIHHLYGFRKITYEIFENLNMDEPKDLASFTDDDLELLRKETIEVNNKYGLGVCLTKGVHKLFHDNYGYGDNTPEQFEEFKRDFENGKYKHLIEGGELVNA